VPPCFKTHVVLSRDYFSFLTLNPEILPNRSNSSKRDGIDSARCDENTIASSAYNAVLCTISPVLIPWIEGCVLGSMAITNSTGEMGDPCLVPRNNSKG
uniref:Uncharacterized protein n=1 Tax=Esox lucius TaxID=8010 RepID=A0AAY5KQE2_ESOLU